MFGTKKKLMAAVVMLVISAIMMTSASYAWFTISTNPEISDMKTQVVVNENLEIALDKTGSAPGETTDADHGNQYTWGNIIDLSAANGGDAYDAYNSIDKTLRPATLATTKFQYPVYGTDGRISTLDDLTIGSMTDGFGVLTGAGNKVYGYYIDFWLRSNVGGKLTLGTTGAGVSRSSSGDMGKGAVLKSTDNDLLSSVMIAFQPNGTGTITAATPAVGTGETRYTADATNGITTLVAEVATKVRMFVYYEGANKYNKDALIGDALVEAALNVQFTIDGVNTSMDKVYSAPSGGEEGGEG